MSMTACVHVSSRDDGDERTPVGLDDVSDGVGENPVISRGATGGQKKGKKKKTFEDM